MRNLHRLPPLLRVASVLALLFPLAVAGSYLGLGILLLLHLPVAITSALVILTNLGVLSGACSFAVRTYSKRFEDIDPELEHDARPFALDSWQSQLRVICLLSALPLCGLILALLIPPTSEAFAIVFPVSILGTIVLLAVLLTHMSSTGQTRLPQA